MAQFFAHYRDSLADTPRARELFVSENAEIQFLEFNWMLNETKNNTVTTTDANTLLKFVLTMFTKSM